MSSVDYYRLLKEGPIAIADSNWDEVLKEVINPNVKGTVFEAASEVFLNVIFDGSSKWVEKKAKIVQGAEKISITSSQMSDYCLSSLKNLCSKPTKREDAMEEAPELALIHRQVSDHLRRLNSQKKVLSHRLRAKSGKDLCNLWGLPDWGESWLQRQPYADMEEIKEELPVILSSQAGKGVFDYNDTLPGYLPTILLKYSAALSTAQMSSTVISKISPPLIQTSISIDGDELHIENPDNRYPGCVNMPSPDQLLGYKQLRETFLGKLTDRETSVFELKEAGFSIDEIALKLDCSKRTINNDWRSIFSKCRQTLAA